jgi:hypothetical protein
VNQTTNTTKIIKEEPSTAVMITSVASAAVVGAIAGTVVTLVGRKRQIVLERGGGKAKEKNTP